MRLARVTLGPHDVVNEQIGRRASAGERGGHSRTSSRGVDRQQELRRAQDGLDRGTTGDVGIARDGHACVQVGGRGRRGQLAVENSRHVQSDACQQMQRVGCAGTAVLGVEHPAADVQRAAEVTDQGCTTQCTIAREDTELVFDRQHLENWREVTAGLTRSQFIGFVVVLGRSVVVRLAHRTLAVGLQNGAQWQGLTENTDRDRTHVTSNRCTAERQCIITTAGAGGTNYVHTMAGCTIATADHGQVFVDSTVKLTNAFQPFMRDSYAAATIVAPAGTGVFGLPRVALFSNPQQWPWIVGVGNPGGAGIKFGTGESLGFFNANPVSQPLGAAQAAVTGTAAGTYDAATQTLINNTMTLANKLRTDLVALGLIKGSA